MTAHHALPGGLDPNGFTVAEAVRAGAGYGRLRGRDLSAPYAGTRIATGIPLTIEARARLVLRRLGDGVFVSHRSAAAVWRFQLETSAPAPLHVSVVAPRRAPHASAISGHSLRLTTRDVTRRSGLPVTTPIRTWLDLAAIGSSTEELVVAGDRITNSRAPLASLDDLCGAVDVYRGRGIRRLREALPLISDRSDSSRETRVRTAILAHGLPKPVLQLSIHGGDGSFIGIADFAFPEYRVLLEYEGDHHRTERPQWSRDLARFNRYQEEGWIALRIDAGQYATMATTLQTLEEVLRRRGWRPGA